MTAALVDAIHATPAITDRFQFTSASGWRSLTAQLKGDRRPLYFTTAIADRSNARVYYDGNQTTALNVGDLGQIQATQTSR